MATRTVLGLSAAGFFVAAVALGVLLQLSLFLMPAILMAAMLVALLVTVVRRRRSSSTTIHGRDARRSAVAVGIAGLVTWALVLFVASAGTWDLAADIGLMFAAWGVLILTGAAVLVLLVRGRTREETQASATDQQQ